MSDAELRALYERYAAVLFQRCRNILKNDEEANDAVQETFARVIVHAGEFRRQSSPLTWMYRISTNYCLNQVRNRNTRRDKRHHYRQDIAGASTLDAPDAAALDHQRILELLDGVDEQTRKVVVYTYFDDCTRQEVADLVGISVPTVRKRLETFLTTARRALGAIVVLFLHLLNVLGRVQ